MSEPIDYDALLSEVDALALRLRGPGQKDTVVTIERTAAAIRALLIALELKTQLLDDCNKQLKAAATPNTSALRKELDSVVRNATRYNMDNGKAVGHALNIFDRAVAGDLKPVVELQPHHFAALRRMTYWCDEQCKKLMKAGDYDSEFFESDAQSLREIAARDRCATRCTGEDMSAQERFNTVTRNHCSYTALDYAEQTMRVYRKAVLTSRKRGFEKPHHASLPKYRFLFIQDYLGFKQIIAIARARGERPAPCGCGHA